MWQHGLWALSSEIYSYSRALFEMSAEDDMCTIYVQNVLNVT